MIYNFSSIQLATEKLNSDASLNSVVKDHVSRVNDINRAMHHLVQTITNVTVVATGDISRKTVHIRVKHVINVTKSDTWPMRVALRFMGRIRHV